MKKFLKNIAIFIPLAFAGYVLAICFFGEVFPTYFKSVIRYRRFGGGHLYSRVTEAKTVRDVDILFIGTSHCYRGFDTRIFENAGYKSFNLGSSIQTPIQTKLLLERYLDKMNPRLVVFETNPVAFCSDGVESSVDVISNDAIDIEAVKMAFQVNSMKTYNTLIFALYRQLTGIGKHQRELRKYYNDTYIPGGFVEAKMMYYDGKGKFTKTEYELQEKQLVVFDEVLEQLKRKNTLIMLVQAPVTNGLYHSKTNNRVFDSLMRVRGVYYNFNEMLLLTDTLDFYDDNHLNQNGVVKFNSRLVDIIRRDKLVQ